MLKASLKWRSEYMPEEIRWVIILQPKNLQFYYKHNSLIDFKCFSSVYLEFTNDVSTPLWRNGIHSNLTCLVWYFGSMLVLYCCCLIRMTLQWKQRRERFTDRLTKINMGGRFLSWGLVVRLYLQLTFWRFDYASSSSFVLLRCLIIHFQLFCFHFSYRDIFKIHNLCLEQDHNRVLHRVVYLFMFR